MKRHSTNALAAFIVAVVLLVPRLAVGEEQPHMQEALRHLQAAAEELQRATHDKGGHREKALEAVQQAIWHVNEGIRYDNIHRSQQDRRDHKYSVGQ